MSHWDGVSFGSDQIGPMSGSYGHAHDHMFPPRRQTVSHYDHSYYPNGITQFTKSPGVFAYDMSHRPWAEEVDQLALTTKLAENQMRDSYKKKEHMSGGPDGLGAPGFSCSCSICTSNINPHTMFYIFMFILIIFLILHYSMSNQLSNLKDLFFMTNHRAVA